MACIDIGCHRLSCLVTVDVFQEHVRGLRCFKRLQVSERVKLHLMKRHARFIDRAILFFGQDGLQYPITVIGIQKSGCVIMSPPVLVATYQPTCTVVCEAVIFFPAFVTSVIYRFDLGQIGIAVIFIRNDIKSGCTHIERSAPLFGQTAVRQELVLRGACHTPLCIVVFVGDQLRIVAQSHLCPIRRIVYEIRHQMFRIHIHSYRIKIHLKRCIRLVAFFTATACCSYRQQARKTDSLYGL